MQRDKEIFELQDHWEEWLLRGPLRQITDMNIMLLFWIFEVVNACHFRFFIDTLNVNLLSIMRYVGHDWRFADLFCTIHIHGIPSPNMRTDGLRRLSL